METQNPATPPSGATPGSKEEVITAPSATTPPNNGDVSEGKVTITTKEFAQLQRDAARARSNDKRNQINNRKNISINNNDGDPDVAKAIEEANNRAADAEKVALQFQVKGQVRDLLEKDEFKSLPKSTKELILKSPHLLSDADNLDEAMLDIEDFIRDQVLVLETASNVVVDKTKEQPGHETPPAVNAGSPAPTGEAELEDISKLSGVARSTAMIRNQLKKNKK